MKRIAMRSLTIWLLVLLLLGGLGFFLVEYVMHSKQWVMSQGSPHIYKGDKTTANGVFLDREGILLLDTTNGRTYGATEQLRSSTIHWLGDRYGYISAPAVSTYANEMSGYDMLTGLYAGVDGGKATLTISAKLQMVAQEAMGDRKGTIALMNYRTGELLCALSTPNYDPDHVPNMAADDTGAYEGVYMNRFTQSVYIPGSIFKIVTTAIALEQIEDIHEQTFTCTGEVDYGEYDVTCEKEHGELDFDSAMAQSCNCAYAQIVEQLGKETLEAFVEKYAITESVTFDGITTAKGNFDLTDTSRLDVAWSGIGQHKDQINPCRYLTFISTIANDGREVQPYVVQSVSNSVRKTYTAETKKGERIMSQQIAEELQRMMRNNVTEKYGEESFPADLEVCGKTGTAQVGGDKKSTAMFAGFLQNEDYPIAFFVAVEDSGYGREICIPILYQVLEACKEIL